MNDSDIANQSLKIYLPLVRCGEVRLTIDALEVLERVYNAFLRWDKLVAQADGDARDGVHYRGTPDGDSEAILTLQRKNNCAWRESK
jgi:hypothetical protein